MHALGNRICIIGPSSSGKSTLAQHLSKQTGLPAYHLDLIAHVPGTKWKRRDDTDLMRDHDRLITQDCWIIEGNYSICMPQRFARADSVIWIDPFLPGSVMRYIKRCLAADKERPGRLAGTSSEFSLYLIKYTLMNYPVNRRKYETLIGQNPHLKTIRLKSMKDLNQEFYNLAKR